LRNSTEKILLKAKSSITFNVFSFIIVLGMGFYKVMDLVYHKTEARKYEGYISSRKIHDVFFNSNKLCRARFPNF